jgi:hypothetical protein
MVAPTDPVLHLYENNYTPDETSTIASFTETTKQGYTPRTLAGTGWTTTTGAATTAVYSEVTFNFTTSATIYGYYVTSTTGALLWAEKFGEQPFNLPTGGGTIAISSRIELE